MEINLEHVSKNTAATSPSMMYPSPYHPDEFMD